MPMSSSSMCRIRPSASTFFAWQARACSRISTRWSGDWSSRSSPRRHRPSPPEKQVRLKAGVTVASIVSSLRYLLADVIGEDDAALPFLPDNLPDHAAPVVSDAILLLAEYQGASHAQLYVDRLKRFIGRPGVDAALFCEIARLMAMRMSYEDPIRIAQLKLAESGSGASGPAEDIRKLRLDELIRALPAPAADPLLDVLGRIGWLRKRVPVRFSAKSRFGIRRLKLEASLRRWRQFSVRYNEERIWVERWLHMIARCL